MGCSHAFASLPSGLSEIKTPISDQSERFLSIGQAPDDESSLTARSHHRVGAELLRSVVVSRAVFSSGTPSKNRDVPNRVFTESDVVIDGGMSVATFGLSDVCPGAVLAVSVTQSNPVDRSRTAIKRLHWCSPVA